MPMVSLRSLVLFAPLAALLAASPAQARPARPRGLAVPTCPGPLCATAGPPVALAKGKRLVWLVFDGVALTRSNVRDDAASDQSAIVQQSMTVPAFDAGDLDGTGGLSRQQIIHYTVAELESIFAPYDVDFVTERPTGSYSSIVFGGTCNSVAGTFCGGIALLDCGDSMPRNITFVFPDGLDYRDLAATAAQESAHAFGLAHTADDGEVMFPQIQPGFYPDHFGDGDAECCSSANLSGGGCYVDEVAQGLTCDRTRQNSHQVMLQVIGPRGQDVYGPEVVITSHQSGDSIREGEIIRAEISDVAGVTSAELLIGNAPAGEVTAPPYDFAFPAGVAGQVEVGIRATDGKQNVSITRVTLVAPGGEPTPCSEDGGCAVGFVCSGDVCVSESASESDAGCGCRTSGAGGLPGLLALGGVVVASVRRRRRR